MSVQEPESLRTNKLVQGIERHVAFILCLLILAGVVVALHAPTPIAILAVVPFVIIAAGLVGFSRIRISKDNIDAGDGDLKP